MPRLLSLGLVALAITPALADLPPGVVGRLGDPTFRAAGTAFALSPDGTTIALADSDTAVRLVDAETWADRGTLSLPTPRAAVDGRPAFPNAPRTVNALRFSADGNRLYAQLTGWGGDQSIIWDVRGGKVEWTAAGEARLGGRQPTPALSADLGRLARYSRPDRPGPFQLPGAPPPPPAAGRSGIQVVNWKTGETSGPITGLRVSVIGSERLVLSPDGGRVAGWVAEDIPAPRVIEGARPGPLAERPAVTVWDVATGKEVGQVPARGTVKGVAFSPDGARVAVQYGGDDDERGVWDLAAGKWLCQFVGPDWAGPTVFLGNDTVAVVARGGTFQRRAVATGKLLDFVPGPADDGYRLTADMARRPDGSVRICGRVGATFVVWDVAPGAVKPARVFGGTAGPMMPAQAMAFTPDGRTLRTLTAEGLVGTYDVPTRRPTGRRLLRPPMGEEYMTYDPVRLSPDARFAVLPGRLLNRVWDLDRGLVVGAVSGLRPLHTVADDGRIIGGGPDPLDAVVGVADRRTGEARGISADGRYGAVLRAPGDGQRAQSELVVYDLTTRTAEKTIRVQSASPGGQLRLTFAAGNRFLVLASGRTEADIRVWDWRTGRDVVRTRSAGVAFSPDHRLAAINVSLYAGSTTGPATFAVVETASGRQRFSSPSGPGAAAFSPDGRVVAVPAPDASILLWDLTGAGASPLRPADRDAAWAGLGHPDAAKAFAHMARLIATPAEAIPLIRDRIRPADATAEIARLIRQLDADDLATREAASRELGQLGEAAPAAAQKALEANPSPEVRRRLEFLIADGKSQGHLATLRPVRAVEVLERIGTPAAMEVLRSLAAGPDDVVTAEAKGALGRVK